MRITEKDVERMAALRAEGLSWKKIGDTIGCSETSVRRHLAEKKAEVAEMADLKKEQRTQDILDYMDSMTDRVCAVLDVGMERIYKILRDEENPAALNQVATTMGILIDKWTSMRELMRDTGNGENGSGVVMIPESTYGEE